MQVEFIHAKNGRESVKANGILLHSAYNPETEADRFVQGLCKDFIPKYIVILEGGLSYCLPFLRKKFPGSKLGTVRFTDAFSNYDKGWDFVIKRDIAEKLFNALGEEGLFQSLFFEWPAAARAFPDQTKAAWKEIRAALEKAKSVLGTREYFGERWLKNKVNFFLRIQNARVIEKITKPVLICASGPSLETALDSIKACRNKIFLCAVSSAVSVLTFHGIKADICLSTDGGFWAKRHLEHLVKSKEKIPLALAAEGAAPSGLFSGDIIPLCYDDDELSKLLFEKLNLTYNNARRNGSVSGSALELFLDCTKKSRAPVFFAGLDLSPLKGFSHTQPNALETEAAAVDFRLRPLSLRAAKSGLPSPSLDIYASWFMNFNLRKRSVFRIKGKDSFSNSLGGIRDISAKEFLHEADSFTDCKTEDEVTRDAFNTKGPLPDKKERAAAIREILTKYSSAESFRKEMFPADYIMFERAASSSEKDALKMKMTEKSKELIKRIFRQL